MHVTLVYVTVTSDHVVDFREATRANHRASIQEPDNFRFDILQSTDNPAQFVLYESYTSAAAAAAHKKTAHYLAWREQVADWMAEPRKGVTYEGLFPSPEMIQ